MVTKLQFEQFKQLNDKLSEFNNIESGEELRTEFLDRLEMAKLKDSETITGNSYYKISFRVAASILLFVFGGLFGYLISHNNTVKELQTQVLYLQQSYTSSILKEQTVSSKIRAINYFDGEKRIQPEFLSILENILNNDDNVNVRITAAKALSKYSTSNEVNDILLNSLKIQTEPLVQIELIEYLVNEDNTKVIDELKQLLENQNTDYIVKEYANKGLEVLL